MPQASAETPEVLSFDSEDSFLPINVARLGSSAVTACSPRDRMRRGRAERDVVRRVADWLGG